MRTLALLLVCLVPVVGCGRKETSKGTVTRLVCDPESMTIESGPLPGATTKGTGILVGTGRFSLRVIEPPCHRFELPLVGSGPLAAADVPAGDFRRSYGIVRYELPNTLTTIGQADSAFADSTIASAYVVHGLDGGYFLDVHLANPSRADSRATPSPEGEARIGLQLAVGGGAIPTRAPRDRNVVVLEPRNGSVTYPIVVKGYARTFEANVQGWVEQNNAVIAASKSFTTAADWTVTWGEFELTIPSGPEGDIVLFVGEESAKDGTPIGVRIPLRASAAGR